MNEMRMVVMLLIILQFEYHYALVACLQSLKCVRLSGQNYLFLIGKDIILLRQHNRMRLNKLDFDGIEYHSD